VASFFDHSLAHYDVRPIPPLSTKADLRRVLRTGALTKEPFEALPAERLRRSMIASRRARPAFVAVIDSAASTTGYS
jgi:hypothetical protein